MKQARTRKSAEARKAEIIDAALRLAAEIGPDRLTTERLAAEIGLSQPGIFRHFPTKADIWTAVAARIERMLRENAARHGDRQADPAGRVQNLVVRQLTFLAATPAIPAILFSRELHAENEDLRLFFVGMMANLQRHFSALIAADRQAGRVNPSVDPDDAAKLVMALIQGLAMRWSLCGRDFDLAAEGARLLKLQWDGFRP